MARTSLYSVCRKKLLVLFSVLVFVVSTTNAQNPIVTENALAGTPKATWDISGAGDLSIQGFATDISVNKGQTVHFKIETSPAASYTITIYRIGYYQGNGARLIASLGTFSGVVQPNGAYNSSTGLLDASNWSESASWAVPATAVSGLYIAKLTKTSGGGSSHIPFIVRDDASTSDILLKTSDNTWQAYNAYGGNSLYVGSTSYPNGHAAKVSLNRPYITRNGGGGGGVAQDWFMNAEFPMIKFLERNGYNISYTTDVDMDRDATPITPAQHKIIISSGHDEYWSLNERNKVTAARDAGVHLAFFSGNEVYWKVRWEDNYRTLVCYKEGTLGENVCGNKCDPTSAWTGLWRDGAAYDAGNPENGLTGQISWNDVSAAITVTGAYKSLRFWRGTAVASLAATGSIAFTAGTLGYEWDPQQYPEAYPHGQIALSSQTVSGKEYRLSLYRAPSGALVFGSGTVQWAWGLDNIHDNGSAAANVNMQQATINLFADMGVQPATLMAGLTAATASTDFTAPVVNITSPANGATLSNNTAVTISGTASDVGGVLIGVEISVDGGTTWQLVNGTSSWTYSWTPTLPGAATIKVRGFDDSGNMGVPGASGSSSNINVTINGSAPTCPCNIFPATVSPLLPLDQDGQPIEVGVKIRSSIAGYITGVRFWKGGTSNNGTHIGHLWNSAGTKLAEANFSGETSSGWQTVTFTAPVAISANTTYVASYFSPSGYYASSNPYFSTAVTNGYLTALANGTDGSNGVYLYTSTGGFPINGYQSQNNWVDVVFNPSVVLDTTKPTVSITAPAAGNVSGVVNITANASDNIAVAGVQFLLNGSNLGAEVTTAPYTYSWNTSSVVNGSYTLTAKARDAAGNTTTSAGVVVTVNNAPDTQAPTVSITAPAAGTVTGTISVTANASDNIGVAGVQFLLNGVNLGAEDVAAPYSVSWNTFTVANGTYTLTARARDGAGNTTTSTGVTVTVSNSSMLTAALPFNEGTGTTTADISGNNHPGTLTGSPVWGAGKYGQGLTFNGTSNYVNIADHNDFTLDPTQNYTWSAWVKNTSFKEWSTVWSQTLDGNNFFYFYAHTTTDPDGGPVTNGISVYWWTSGGTNKLGAHSTSNVLTAGTWSYVAITYDASQSQNNRFTIYVNGVDVTDRTDISSTGTLAAINPTNIRVASNQPFGEYLNGSVDEVRYYKRLLSLAEVQADMNSPLAPDVTPPTVSSVSPLSGATGVSTGTTVTAIFSEALNASTITGSTFQLRDPSNVLVTATVTYNAATNTATLTPSAALVNSTVYTAKIISGASGVKDAAGNALAADYTWSFTTVGDITPPTVTSVSPTNGSTGVSAGTIVIANFSEAVSASTVTTSTFQLKDPGNNVIPATVGTSLGQITLTPSSALANGTVYTATITGGASGVKDLAGNALATNYSWSFTTVVVDNIPPTITSVSPVNGATNVSAGTTVSAVFSEALNASTVSTATFELRNPSNVLVTATVTYNAATNTATLTPSSALAYSTVYTAKVISGASGVKDAAGNALASDYVWSFTILTPDLTPPTVTTVTPANGGTAVAIGTTLTAVFSETMTVSTITNTTFELRNASNTLVAATVNYNSGTNTATLTPSAALAYASVYTARVISGASGVKDAAGNALASDYTWSFTVVAAPPVTYSIFPATSTPATAANNDGQAIEVGVKFRVTQAGYITALRFYKGAANTGTHTGHLWSSTGTLLATAVFTNETASGWQQVLLSTPVAISANTTYVASYFSSAGYYAVTNPYFTAAVTNGPISALANGTDGGNGVYKYSATSAFPNTTYQTSNYWVDVVFTTSLGRMMQPQQVQQIQETSLQKLIVKVSPNPAAAYFKLIVMSDDKTPITVRVLDISGRMVGSEQKMVPNTLLRIGDAWHAGTYFAEVVQGDQRKVVKIIKIK